MIVNFAIIHILLTFLFVARAADHPSYLLNKLEKLSNDGPIHHYLAELFPGVFVLNTLPSSTKHSLKFFETLHQLLLNAKKAWFWGVHFLKYSFLQLSNSKFKILKLKVKNLIKFNYS